MSSSVTESCTDHARDARLDALLRRDALALAPHFADSVLRRIEAGDDDCGAASPLDALVDECLAAHPVRARPGCAERLFNGVVGWERHGNILRWAFSAAAAVLVVSLMLSVVIRNGPAPVSDPVAGRATCQAEEILDHAMANDPVLADMLQIPPDGADSFIASAAAVRDAEIAEAISDLNDNTLAWLETLTFASDEEFSHY
ncbi:MAG: hypothetical protein LBG65_01760 [Puniceicoccales bacterium]|nr:hypothetical protein [Puniceicoccales bacterium]